MNDKIKLDIGCGRRVEDGFVGIDRVQIIDGRGKQLIGHVVNLECEPIPYPDSSVDEIKADSFLEHIGNLEHLLNECWRVLKPDGFLRGVAPMCGTRSHWKDPTHKRCFIKDTFCYFVGPPSWNPELPGHPRYANYGFKRWKHVEPLKEEGDVIYFKMSPDKDK